MKTDRDTAVSEDHSEAGAPGNEEEIEVTPEMIEAGACRLFQFHHESHDGEDVVVEIYRAMRRLAPNS